MFLLKKILTKKMLLFSEFQQCSNRWQRKRDERILLERHQDAIPRLGSQNHKHIDVPLHVNRMCSEKWISWCHEKIKWIPSRLCQYSSGEKNVLTRNGFTNTLKRKIIIIWFLNSNKEDEEAIEFVCVILWNVDNPIIFKWLVFVFQCFSVLRNQHVRNNFVWFFLRANFEITDPTVEPSRNKIT